MLGGFSHLLDASPDFDAVAREPSLTDFDPGDNDLLDAALPGPPCDFLIALLELAAHRSNVGDGRWLKVRAVSENDRR